MYSQADELYIASEKQLRGKWILTSNMALSLAVSGALHLALVYIVIQKASVLKLTTQHLEIIYYFGFLSRASGSCSGGILFDYVEMPRVKHSALSLNALLLCISALCIPPARNPLLLIWIVIVCEFWLGCFDTGICSYCFYLWQKDNPQYFQGIQFFYAFGMFAMAWYYHEIVFSLPRSDVTGEVGSDYLMFYFVIMFLALVSILWCVVSFILYSIKYDIDALLPELRNVNYQRISPVHFAVRLTLTTCLSCMISAVAFGYPKILSSLEKVASLKKSAFLDIGIFYWGIFLFARSQCTIFSFMLSSAQLIILGIFLQICAGGSLIVNPLHNKTMIDVKTALVAFGASCVYPSTFLYLHEHVPVSAKMVAILFIASYLAEMTTPLWLEKLVEENINNSSYFILLFSSSYLIVFTILCCTIETRNWRKHEAMRKIIYLKSIEKLESQPPQDSSVQPENSEEQPEEPTVHPMDSDEDDMKDNKGKRVTVDSLASQLRLENRDNRKFLSDLKTLYKKTKEKENEGEKN